MSFVVAIRIQLEGDAEIFREMIMQYREDCLANESGMGQFLICSIPDDEGFLLFEVFSDQEAHQLHSQGGPAETPPINARAKYADGSDDDGGEE